MKLSNIKYLSYLILFIGLYLGNRYTIYSIGIFGLVQIVSLIKEGSRPISQFSKVLLLPIGFYLLHIISAFYSSNHSEALFDLEVKFSFLALPLLIGFQKQDPKIDFNLILRLFVASSLAASAFFIIMNMITYFEVGHFLYYMEYSFLLHPSYLSMYLTFNILVGFYLISNNKGAKLCSIISILLSLVNIYFAESKAGQLITFVVLIFLAFNMIKPKYRIVSVVASIFLLIIFGYIVKDNGRFKSILYAYDHYKEITSNPQDVRESTALRLLVWKASTEIIIENPILGVGNGDVKDELTKTYLEHKYIKAYDIKMNSHNQYLETGVGLGLIGVFFLIVMLITPIFTTKEYHVLIYGFIIIISLNIIVESMFNTQAGVIFIASMYSMLLFYSSLYLKSK